MTDHFAVLGQPRRPWLDVDQLKQKFQELTLALHPDRQKQQQDALEFSVVTEAYRVLSNPRTRLQHLLVLEDDNLSVSTNVPNELGDIFMEAATLVQQIDSHRQKRDQSSSALGKSLLQAETAQLQGRADQMLGRLENQYHATLDDLRRIDEAWTRDSPTMLSDLHVLADRFGFLDRWLSQLRERQFQLST